MKARRKFNNKPPQKQSKPKSLKEIEKAEVQELEQKILELAPPRGSLFHPETPVTTFQELPISSKTKKGLKDGKFIEMTEIQRSAIMHALAGRDILGAARTGSGKTLAFLIPVLELLYRKRWNVGDGLGALIISPTRELALQIFDVLRIIGKHHSLSAGLIIGGKDVKSEQSHIQKMSILVATPGRVLQHLEQTPNFSADNLQALVLDEADRILDMGFSKTLNAIVEHLPTERLTLLFSATQTKSVKDIARLSLHEPEYVSVHENSLTSTPKNLVQNYVVCSLGEKLDVLFSFIKTHLDSKMLIFFSSCKQVKFAHEVFCKLKPGIPVACLHGNIKQMKRLAIFYDFVERQSACLLATDIAARGLDFPEVDWVIQVDCPEDPQTYIHRAGRTARLDSEGKCLLMLLPSELKMVELIQNSKVPIEELKINTSKIASIQGQIASFLSQDPELKFLAQKVFISYVRSVFLQKNKEVFDVHSLPFAEFAASLGLPSAPNIKFVKKGEKKENKQETIPQEEEPEEEGTKKKKYQTKMEKLLARKNTSVLSEAYSKLREVNEEDEDDFLVKRTGAQLHEDQGENDSEDEDGEGEDEDEEGEEGEVGLKKKLVGEVTRQSLDVPLLSNKKSKMLVSSKKGGSILPSAFGLSKKIVFDQDGNQVKPGAGEGEENEGDTADGGDGEEDERVAARKHAEKERNFMKERDKEDKLVQKTRKREKMLAKREKEKARSENQSGGGGRGAVLGPENSASEDESEDDGKINADESGDEKESAEEEEEDEEEGEGESEEDEEDDGDEKDEEGEEDEEDEEDEEKNRKKRGRTGDGKKLVKRIKKASLEEKEDLILSMLSRNNQI